MGPPDPVIDLGVLAHGRAEPDRGAASPRQHGRSLRAPVAAVVAVLCATVLSGSTAPPPPFAVLLWTADVGPGLLDLGRETIYVGEAGAGGGVAALGLGTGIRRWRLDLGERAYGISENGHGQVVVTSGFSGGRSTLLSTSVEVGTGRLLNEAPGLPLGRTADGQIYVLDATGPEGPLGSGLMLSAFRPAGGVPAWSRRLPVTGQVWIDRDAQDSARWVVTVSGSGQVEVWDPVTGAQAGSGRIPTAARAYGPAAGPISAVVSGRLLAVYSARERLTVSAYRLPDMARQWSASLPPGGDVGTDYAFGDCGDLLCVRRTGETEVVDPDNGRVLVRTTGDVQGRLAGGLISVVRLAHGQGESLIFDPRTGHQLATYPGWVVSDWPTTGGALLYRADPDRMSFARVDETGALRVLGEVHGRELNCQARDAVLACLDSTGRLSLWRLRLP